MQKEASEMQKEASEMQKEAYQMQNEASEMQKEALWNTATKRVTPPITNHRNYNR